MLPIIILYDTIHLKGLGDNASAKLKGISGIHQCHFHYSDSSNNNKRKRVRIKIEGEEYGVIAEIGRNNLCFVNPLFKSERMMEAVNEDDGLPQECYFIYLSFHHDPLNYIIENNYHSQLPEIRSFFLACSNIKKPILPAHAEKEKEIWTAYCDGLNALNRERREFLTLNYVGNPILYNDTRQGEIYTIKLGIVKDSLDDLKKKLTSMLEDKYRIGSIDLNEEQGKVVVIFKGTEKINNEDLEQVSEYLQTFGFSISKEGICNILRVSFTAQDLRNRKDLYDQLDALLQEKGVLFTNNERLEYYLNEDSDVPTFKACVEKVFGERGYGVLYNFYRLDIPLSQEERDTISEAFADDVHIAVEKNAIGVVADSRDEYNKIINKLDAVLNENRIDCEYPEYQAICVVRPSKSDTFRQERMNSAFAQLEGLRKKASYVEYDAQTARVIRLEFKFKSAHERESIIDDINEVAAELGADYKLVNKNPLGLTQMEFERNAVLMERLEEGLKNEYVGEEIKLVNGRIYNDSFNGVIDPDNIVDSALREKYNRFMSECPIIGTCHKRGADYIIVNLSEDFYNGERLKESIKQKDMVFFPSVGSSTEIRRQSDAIRRINNPGKKLPNGKKVTPPVNPALCQFLFNPLFAREIKANIPAMMELVEKNKLEEHLNEKQVEAVAKAVLAEDICFIQGPPGTGKTTVIAEIIWQEILRNSKCKILLTSQTNLAVDNALERLKYKKNIRPLRVISELRNDSDDLIYNANILDEWMLSPNERNNDNVVNTWIDDIIHNIDKHPQYAEATREWHDYLTKKDENVRKYFVSLYKSGVNLIAATCSLCGSQQFMQAFTQMFEANEVAFDVVIMDEASKATPLEMAIPMVLGKKIIVIGDHKQLPPLLDEGGIENALRKIKRDDLADRIQDLKESQFKKLFQMAQKFRPSLVTTLNTQYRMHKDIMQTINQFYVDELGENGLVCGIEEVQNTPNFSIRGSRWHGITWEPFINPSTHAIWVNVEGKEEKGERMSYKNMAEIKAVKTVMTALTRASGFEEYINSQQRLEDQEIGLITFYSDQRRELKKLEQSGALDPAYDYRIEVVDRFQGMERNIIIVSTVRSNKFNGIGFAKEIERINVAFSRARSLLIVIGNRELFATQYNYRQAIAAMETVDIKQIEDMISYGE